MSIVSIPKEKYYLPCVDGSFNGILQACEARSESWVSHHGNTVTKLSHTMWPWDFRLLTCLRISSICNALLSWFIRLQLFAKVTLFSDFLAGLHFPGCMVRSFILGEVFALVPTRCTPGSLIHARPLAWPVNITWQIYRIEGGPWHGYKRAVRLPQTTVLFDSWLQMSLPESKALLELTTASFAALYSNLDAR